MLFNGNRRTFAATRCASWAIYQNAFAGKERKGIEGEGGTRTATSERNGEKTTLKSIIFYGPDGVTPRTGFSHLPYIMSSAVCGFIFVTW